jgi:hypothetical protein
MDEHSNSEHDEDGVLEDLDITDPQKLDDVNGGAIDAFLDFTPSPTTTTTTTTHK